MKLISSASLIIFLLLVKLFICEASPIRRYTFVVKEKSYTRLCSTKKILTINGKFPGPTLHAHKGDTLIVHVYNKGDLNITLHWHGVKQPRNPWPDGPEYITQCPIQPGGKFTQTITLSTEEGTLWWHAHSDWTRATVHGAIIIYPKKGTIYPFPKPHAEFPIILGEWWKKDVNAVLETMLETGGGPEDSDSYLINGQPGDFLPCSKKGTYRMTVHYGKTYLLRMINAALQDILFFAIANHTMTIVGSDASYTKPYNTDYAVIGPGQTLDILLKANQKPDDYYLAAKAYVSTPGIGFDNTTTSAILQYKGTYNPSSPPPLPELPNYNDTEASLNFSASLRSLADKDHPCLVPLTAAAKFFFTTSINTFPCVNDSCAGPNGTRLASSMNNVSFVLPTIDILDAYYYNISGVYEDDFPSTPPLVFNYTADYLPVVYEIPAKGTKVKVLEYNTTVELVLQSTHLVSGADHPIHLHGYSFYVLGLGLGNFDKDKDPLNYNLVDPPMRNTVNVPRNGWAAIRFKASNPGVWFMHCHLERHLTWGMDMTFIVKDGDDINSKMLPPPPDMPPC